MERDSVLDKSMGLPNESEFEERITRIKELCIATLLLEMTRSLDREKKGKVRGFCDQTLFQQHHREDKAYIEDFDLAPNLLDYHQKKIDPLRVMNVSNLKFEDFGRSQLLQFYEESKEHQGGFQMYYSNILEIVYQLSNDKSKTQNT